MDKAISIGAAVLLGLCLVYFVWFLSAGWTLDSSEKSLERGLSALGGRLGAWGGVGLIILATVAAYGIHEFCNYWVGFGYARMLRSQGHTDEGICERMERWRISGGLKKRLRRSLTRRRPPTG
ncbi:MAG TPA: hypothetical protein VM431_04575 [Phycisphaerae bacterium]|nr:hypothetical protein [Phycisphaerae bacterium]